MTVPYPWPYDGDLDPAQLALVVAGAQVGWTARSRRASDVAAVLVEVADEVRAAGGLVVAIRHRGHGEVAFPVAPPDEVVDAAGIDGFYGGPLDHVLRSRRADHLVLGGFGHEAAVDSTLRSANDRGYECLVLSDGVAPFDDDLSDRALHSVTMSGGIFGAVGTSRELISALRERVPLEAFS